MAANARQSGSPANRHMGKRRRDCEASTHDLAALACVESARLSRKPHQEMNCPQHAIISTDDIVVVFSGSSFQLNEHMVVHSAQFTTNVNKPGERLSRRARQSAGAVAPPAGGCRAKVS